MSVRCSRRARKRAAERGFTLTELMVVVVIAGILAAIAFASLRNQMNAAWQSEGLTMVQSIKAAQERWRAEHMLYLPVSTDDAWYPADPRDPPGKMYPFYFAAPGQHIDQNAWLALRPSAPGPVRFGFLVKAGPGGTAMPDATDPGPKIEWPVNNNDWYVIEAIGQADADEDVVYMRASSLRVDVAVYDRE